MVVRHALCALAFGALLLSALPTAAQSPFATQETTLAALTPEQNRFFGLSVSLSGDRAIVGSFDGDGSTDAVPVFVRSGDTWVLEDELVPTDGASGDNYGERVAVSGDRALVSASGADLDGDLGAGAVYVFVRSGSTWTQEAKLSAPDAEAFTFFGHTVALSDDRAVVGALGGQNGPAGTGQVYVFARSGSSWAFESELVPLDTPNRLGTFALAISGDRVLASGLGDDEDPRNDPFASGLGYVFLRTGGTWAQEAKLAIPERFPDDGIAQSVALDGDRAVLGAPGEGDGRGAAYVFARSGTTWTQQARVEAAGTGEDETFGRSVATAGDRVFVGATRQDQAPGAVYPFDLVGDVWTERPTIMAADASEPDQFGTSLAQSGDRLIVGATSVDSDGLFNVGAAYIFSDVFSVDTDGGAEAPMASLGVPRPNPTAGRASLALSVGAPQWIRAVLVDALGREALVLADGEVAGATTLQIDTASLAPGVYTVRVQGAALALAQRMTVLR